MTLLAYWLGLRRGAFTCVRWQVTVCDPIWQVTFRSCEMEYPLALTLLYLFSGQYQHMDTILYRFRDTAA